MTDFVATVLMNCPSR